MTVDFSVVLITEKGQDIPAYLLYCMQHNTKMISFSATTLLQETGSVSIESFKKKSPLYTKHRQKEEKKKFPS